MINVSIVIPVYNVEKYLKQCLESVVNQTLDKIEVICINDGSTDNSLNILNEEIHRSDEIQNKTDIMREEWISNITHDLKTPLSPIK